VTIFVPEIKNEAEGKAVCHYFEHPKDFDRGYFDHFKKRFSAEFYKATRRCKHCIFSEKNMFRIIINKNL